MKNAFSNSDILFSLNEKKTFIVSCRAVIGQLLKDNVAWLLFYWMLVKHSTIYIILSVFHWKIVNKVYFTVQNGVKQSYLLCSLLYNLII